MFAGNMVRLVMLVLFQLKLHNFSEVEQVNLFLKFLILNFFKFVCILFIYVVSQNI